MQSVRIEGSTGNDAEVTYFNALQIKPSSFDSNNNPTLATGGFRFFSENDFGYWTGVYFLKPPETTVDYRLRTSFDTLVFYDNFNMTAQNTGVWKTIFTTMTLTAAGGFLLFNTGLTAAASSGVSYTTWRTFPIFPKNSLIAEGTFELNAVPQGNQIFEFGFFLPPAGATAPPADGVYFRFTADGLTGCMNYNGNELTIGDVIKYAPVSNLVMGAHTLYFEIDTRQVQFWVDDDLIGNITIPNGVGAPFLTTSLPMTMQQRNTGTVLSTPLLQVKCAECAVYFGDVHASKPWPHQMAGLSLNAAQLGNGTSTPTIATCSNALYTNSLAAGAGVAMTNNTAALTAGLGGQFGALPTLVVPTDGLLSSFQNPVGSVNIAPRTLYITGVRIQGAITTTLVGGPVLYAYALCYGHTNVNLGVAETGSFVTATTKAPRRIPLGFETYGAAAVAGVLGGPGINVDFAVPIVVNPGEFVAVSAKNLGVVTTAGVINVLVTLTGYFE